MRRSQSFNRFDEADDAVGKESEQRNAKKEGGKGKKRN